MYFTGTPFRPFHKLNNKRSNSNSRSNSPFPQVRALMYVGMIGGCLMACHCEILVAYGRMALVSTYDLSTSHGYVENDSSGPLAHSRSLLQ